VRGEPTTILEFEATGMTYMSTWEGLSHILADAKIGPDNPWSVALTRVLGNPYNEHAIAVMASSAENWSWHTVTWGAEDAQGWWRVYQLGWVPDDLCDEVHDMWFGPLSAPSPRVTSSAHIIEFDRERKPRPLVRIILAL
jgi:hypothetical protein